MQKMGQKVIALSEVSIRLSADTLLYQTQNAAAIDAYWAVAQAQKPALFNGASYLASALYTDEGQLFATYHRTDYKTLLYWRADQRSDKPWHIFASAVIVSADNGLLLGKMAQHTSLAGYCYFPSGSVDDDDMLNGQVDYHSNMQREMFEETGLDITKLKTDGKLYMSEDRHSVALFQIFHCPFLGQDLQKQICNYLKNQDNPELESVTMIYQAADLRHSFPYIQAFTDWYFGRSQLHNAT